MNVWFKILHSRASIDPTEKYGSNLRSYLAVNRPSGSLKREGYLSNRKFYKYILKGLIRFYHINFLENESPFLTRTPNTQIFKQSSSPPLPPIQQNTIKYNETSITLINKKLFKKQLNYFD